MWLAKHKNHAKQLKPETLLQIIDLKQHPNLAEGEQIIAIPTLIKKLPVPMRILVGDLSDKDNSWWA